MDLSVFAEELKADMYKNYWIGAGENKEYQEYKPLYTEICQEKSLKDMNQSYGGAYDKVTSNITDVEYVRKKEKQPVEYKSMAEGYPVYASVKAYEFGLQFSLEVTKQLPKMREDLLSVIRKSVPMAYKLAKERFFWNQFNYGGYTAGQELFNQDLPNGVLTTGYGDKLYDSVNWFNLVGAKRPEYKGGANTKYNALTLPFSPDNIKKLFNLLTDTNGFREDGIEFDNSRDVYLVVPRGLGVDAKSWMKTVQEAASQNNTKNWMQENIAGVISVPYLTGNAVAANIPYYLVRKNCGMDFYAGDAPTFETNIDFDHDIIKVKSRIEIAERITNWRFAAASNAPTSA